MSAELPEGSLAAVQQQRLARAADANTNAFTAAGTKRFGSQTRRLRVAPEVNQRSAHVPDLHGESRARSQKNYLRVLFTIYGKINNRSGNVGSQILYSRFRKRHQNLQQRRTN